MAKLTPWLVFILRFLQHSPLNTNQQPGRTFLRTKARSHMPMMLEQENKGVIVIDTLTKAIMSKN
jgi:hypothetical protein